LPPYLIKKYYERFQENTPTYSIKNAFPQISQLLNTVVNKKNQEMTSQEMLNTWNEINRRRTGYEVYIDSNGNNNKYFFTHDELLYLLNIITDLLTKQSIDAISTRKTDSKTSNGQEKSETIGTDTDTTSVRKTPKSIIQQSEREDTPTKTSIGQKRQVRDNDQMQ
jgi:hypothetical protein